MIFFININSSQAEFPASSDYLSLSRYLSFFFRFTLQTFVRHLSHLPKCQFEARKDRKGAFLQSKAGEMKPFKLNWSFHCLSKAWFYCSNICFGTISFFLARLQWDEFTHFVAKLIMSQIRAFWVLFWLRYLWFYSDFSQMLLRYLFKKLAGGNSAAKSMIYFNTKSDILHY